MLKALITCTLLLAGVLCYGQQTTRLNEVGAKDTVAAGQSIMYGNFIQRLGFKSGGYVQEMYIVNSITKEVLIFRVKPMFKSAKENTFAYHIKPGTYTVFMYQYVESTWYGAKIFKEPVTKTDGSSYTFNIPANSLVNVGTWNFNKNPGTFSPANADFNAKLQAVFSKLDFASSVLVTPE
ncbi:MAG: hypothetical protein V4687_16535 [Bacteroidota bacterium]